MSAESYYMMQTCQVLGAETVVGSQTPSRHLFGPFITRDLALESGLKQYFDGLPCKHGHIATRQTINRQCFECIRLKKEEKGVGISKTRICPVCRSQFSTLNSRKRFCKQACKREWDRLKSKKKNRGPIQRECRWCGVVFITEHSTQAFCCAEHSSRWHYQDRKDDPAKKARQDEFMQRYRRENAEKLRQSYRDYDAKHREERRSKAKHRRSSQDGRVYSNEIAKRARERFKQKHGISPAGALQRNNLNYRIGVRLRKRIWEAVSKQKATRAGSFEEICGCTIQELTRHLEGLWLEGMNWSNYGHDGWHIDHVRPCTSFDLNNIEQQKVCFNWRNMAPLWGSENSAKNATYNAATEAQWSLRMKELGFEGELYYLFT